MSITQEIRKIYGYDFCFKVLLLGDSTVGKSPLLLRFVDNTWDDNSATTIGVDYRVKDLTVRNKNTRLLVYDLSGQERFRSLAHMYLRNCHGIIFVYDITNKESFQNIEDWMREADQYAPPGTVRILIGTKSDLAAQRQVPYKDAREFAIRQGMKYFEVSAKTSTNIIEPFNEITRRMLIAKDDIKLMIYAQKMLKKEPAKPDIIKPRECASFLNWFVQKFNLI